MSGGWSFLLVALGVTAASGLATLALFWLIDRAERFGRKGHDDVE